MDSMEKRDSLLEVGCRVRLVSPGAQWKEVVDLGRTFVDFGVGNLVGRRTLERLIASGQCEVEPQRTVTVVEKDPGALGAL